METGQKTKQLIRKWGSGISTSLKMLLISLAFPHSVRPFRALMACGSPIRYSALLILFWLFFRLVASIAIVWFFFKDMSWHWRSEDGTFFIEFLQGFFGNALRASVALMSAHYLLYEIYTRDLRLFWLHVTETNMIDVGTALNILGRVSNLKEIPHILLLRDFSEAYRSSVGTAYVPADMQTGDAAYRAIPVVAALRSHVCSTTSFALVFETASPLDCPWNMLAAPDFSVNLWKSPSWVSDVSKLLPYFHQIVFLLSEFTPAILMELELVRETNRRPLILAEKRARKRLSTELRDWNKYIIDNTFWFSRFPELKISPSQTHLLLQEPIPVEYFGSGHPVTDRHAAPLEFELTPATMRDSIYRAISNEH